MARGAFGAPPPGSPGVMGSFWVACGRPPLPGAPLDLWMAPRLRDPPSFCLKSADCTMRLVGDTLSGGRPGGAFYEL